MGCDDTKLSAYLDGELPPEERLSLESHLKQCPECAEELARLRKADRMVLDIAYPMTLHSRVLTAVHDKRSARSVYWPRVIAAAAAALFVVSAAVGAIYMWRMTPPGNGATTSSIVPLPVKRQDDMTRTVAPEIKLAQNDTPQLAALHFRLAGTVQGATPQAILVNTDTNQQAIYKIGDEIAPGVKITDIVSGKVTIDANGQAQVLTSGALTSDALKVDGHWTYTLETSGGEKQTGEVVIVQDGVKVTLTPVEAPDTKGEGTLSGQQVKLSFADNDIKDELQGTFTADGNSLTGTLRQENSEGVVTSYTVSAQRANSKSLDDAIAARMRVASLTNELRQMLQPLTKYAQENENKFPVELGALVPNYSATLEKYQSTPQRTVKYDASATRPAPETLKMPSFGTNADAPATIAQKMIAWEAELESKWGGKVPTGSAVITLTYASPAISGSISASGSVRILQGGTTATAGQNDAVYAAMRASDQNNLKQLGLVIKMFQNEAPHEFVPAGWCMVYPEYLTDTNILTSPWDPAGTSSYDLLFPARTQQELIALHEQLMGPIDPGNPAASAKAQSEIPMVMDKTDAPGVAGRNVLFLDGHVQFMRSPDWQTQLKPFLDIAH